MNEQQCFDRRSRRYDQTYMPPINTRGLTIYTSNRKRETVEWRGINLRGKKNEGSWGFPAKAVLPNTIFCLLIPPSYIALAAVPPPTEALVVFLGALLQAEVEVALCHF